MRFFLPFVVGAVTGIITGFGIGGGTLLILYLTLFAKVGQVESQGINLVYFVPSAGAALVSHIKNREIVWRAFFFSAGAGLITTVVGSLLASKIDIMLLRRFFGAFLIVVGVSQIFSKK